MIIDVLFILVIIFAVFRGLSKGFILGIFSMITTLIGLAAALKLSALVANYLKINTGTPGKWLPILSFILVFITVVLLVRLVAKLIEKAAQLAMLGWLNRIGGVIFFGILYVIVFSVFLFYVQRAQLIKQDTIMQSLTYTYIAPLGPKVIDNMGKILPVFKDMFAQLEGFFDSVAKKAG